MSEPPFEWTFEWNEWSVKWLRRYWAEGMSASLIGKCLGCSKNAVVGKVRRLGLPARKSPLPEGFVRKDHERSPQLSDDKATAVMQKAQRLLKRYGTMAEMARKTGIPLGTITTVITGYRRPGFAVARRINALRE